MVREMLDWAGALPEGVAYYLRHRKAVRDLKWNRDMMDAALAELDDEFKEVRNGEPTQA